MGAAEKLELTPAEREFLARLLIKLTGGRPMDERPPVDESSDDNVRPTPEQLAEVRSKVRKHMKRQGAL